MEDLAVKAMFNEFNNYECEKIEEMDQVISFIRETKDYLSDLDEDFYDDITFNNKRIEDSKRLGFLRKLFKIKREEFYIRDNEIIEKEKDLKERFDDIFDRMFSDLNENNYLDINKLAHFSEKKLLSNFDHLEEMRANNELWHSGMLHESCSTPDDSLVFYDFFDEAIEAIMR